jgi:CDP-diacylglycerol--serine O-phosphatidyltransferase
MKGEREEILTNKNGNQKKFRFLPINRLFPNMVTLMALCAGLTSIRFALEQKWELAVTFIIIAGFLDGMDGRIARFLKATSNFGAQLDSLSDFLNFGVAPAVILYLWDLHNIKVRGLGWAIALFYAICCAIRLARFNTALDEDRPAWADKFFVGVPSPAGALLAVTPMMIDFQFEWKIFAHPIYLGIYLASVGLLMTSRLPTFSLKKIVIPREFASLIMACVAFLMVGLVIEPWLTFPVICIIYITLIPISCISYNRAKDLPFYED